MKASDDDLEAVVRFEGVHFQYSEAAPWVLSGFTLNLEVLLMLAVYEGSCDAGDASGGEAHGSCRSFGLWEDHGGSAARPVRLLWE